MRPVRTPAPGRAGAVRVRHCDCGKKVSVPCRAMYRQTVASFGKTQRQDLGSKAQYAPRSMPGMTAMGRKATAFDVAVLALVPVAYDPPSTEAYVPLSASAAQWVSFVANPSTLTTFICSVPTALDTNRPAMRVRQLSTRVWYLLVAPYTTVCVCAERVNLPTSVAGNSGTATETPVSSVTVIDPVSNSKRV